MAVMSELAMIMLLATERTLASFISSSSSFLTNKDTPIIMSRFVSTFNLHAGLRCLNDYQWRATERHGWSGVRVSNPTKQCSTSSSQFRQRCHCRCLRPRLMQPIKDNAARSAMTSMSYLSNPISWSLAINKTTPFCDSIKMDTCISLKSISGHCYACNIFTKWASAAASQWLKSVSKPIGYSCWLTDDVNCECAHQA